MPVKTTRATWYAFIALAAVALVLHLLSFELRFRWYLSEKDSQFLTAVYLGCVTLIVLLWIFYPSRVLVATVAAATFFLPPAMRGDVFVAANPLFMLYVSFVVVLLVAATELRRRTSLH
jgi:hypothetical protein